MRSLCEYCGGNTKLDDYGHCAACGAPDRSARKMAEKKQEAEDYAERNEYNNFISAVSSDAGQIALGTTGGLAEWKIENRGTVLSTSRW